MPKIHTATPYRVFKGETRGTWEIWARDTITGETGSRYAVCDQEAHADWMVKALNRDWRASLPAGDIVNA